MHLQLHHKKRGIDLRGMLRQSFTLTARSSLEFAQGYVIGIGPWHAEFRWLEQVIYEALNARENLGSTGIGDGIAIPHAKLPHIDSMVACFARSQSGIDFDSIDKEPVKLFFALLVPDNSAGLHLKALARISRLLKSDEFRDSLIVMETSDQIYNAFKNFDEGD